MFCRLDRCTIISSPSTIILASRYDNLVVLVWQPCPAGSTSVALGTCYEVDASAVARGSGITKVAKMPRKKLTEEERKEQKRVAERVRLKRIKNNPVLYDLWKKKQKEQYLKKKRQGKIIPIRDMPSKKQKIARVKTRENSKRCYYKNKLALSKSEVKSNSNLEHVNDPFDLPSTSSIGTKQNPPNRLQEHQTCCAETSSAKLPQSPVSVTSNSTARITRFTAKLLQNGRQNDIDLTKHEIEVNPASDVPLSRLGSPSPIISTADSTRSFSPHEKIFYSSPRMLTAELEMSSPASVLNSFPDLHTTESPRSLSPQSSITLNNSPKCSKKHERVGNTDKSIKKKSPWKHLIRRLKYRYNKELKLKDIKIRQLKLVNERYRKQIKRLRKDKVVMDSLKQLVIIDRQESIEIPEETLQNMAESETEKLRNDITRFLEDDENSRICPGKK